jgi:proton-coupled amino acid transporter
MAEPKHKDQEEHHRQFASEAHTEDVTGKKPPTGYLTSIMHLAKCYVGTGIFAMGEGFKNSGLVFGPVMLFLLAIVNLNCQHMLVNAVIKIAGQETHEVKPTFAEAVEYTMEGSSIACLKNNSAKLGWITNIFLCCTELGFCCVYFVFIAEHLVEMASDHDLLSTDDPASKHIMLAIILLPMWLSTFLGNLKLLLPLTVIANILMWAGILIIVYFTTCEGLPDSTERDYISSYTTWPLFFGTALYAFEGITFIVPLRNEMKEPEKFMTPFGVLNVGMMFVASLYILVGILGYWKYGDDVESSVFLNLTTEVQG